jgi:acetyl-CoA acetyltransferase
VTEVLERRSVISGAALADVGRALNRAPILLATEACNRALADAGLRMEDIDGLAVFAPDQGSASLTDLQDGLGLELDWFVDAAIGPSQLSALWEAFMAVACGHARHVLVVHASAEGSERKRLGKNTAPGFAGALPTRAGVGWQRWTYPFAAPSMVHMTAMSAQRHFALYGTTREQLSFIPLVQRENASLNPAAVYRSPLTQADYLGARMISDPLCLYDCDVPIDFGVALVVSSADTTADLRKKPVRVESFCAARRSRVSLDQFDDMASMPLRDVGRAVWERTDLRPADIDVAEIYDGFSFIALAWLEALGFCGKGEGGPFVQGGDNIGRHGVLPMNTHGGQLSAGRMHGWGYVVEACAQLWGEAGERQVPDAEVALVASGGGLYSGAAILTA